MALFVSSINDIDGVRSKRIALDRVSFEVDLWSEGIGEAFLGVEVSA
jgi:hypothetical protein